jgi:hypothetical protein
MLQWRLKKIKEAVFQKNGIRKRCRFCPLAAMI